MTTKQSDRLSALLERAGVVAEDFEGPCVFIIGDEDAMVYLQEDIEYTETLVPRTNMYLLHTKTVPERLVGVKIDGFNEAPTFRLLLEKRKRRIPRFEERPTPLPPEYKTRGSTPAIASIRHLHRGNRGPK